MIQFDGKVTKQEILAILFQSDVKLTAAAYIKAIKQKCSISSSAAKQVVHTLINEQEISYHYLYGTTYVEKSFLKPVRITPHFIVKPPGFPDQTHEGTLEMTIEQGISFGSGQHSTTRLCLEAIEFCFFENQMKSSTGNLPGLSSSSAIGADIGTGSGVLAMAMCLAGLGYCNAYEIDPVSLNEARKNVGLNHLSDHIAIFDQTFNTTQNMFSIISANLRFPTLKALSPIICESLKENGVAVLSGVREWEKETLLTHYTGNGFDLVWQKDDKNWSAFVFIKKN